MEAGRLGRGRNTRRRSNHPSRLILVASLFTLVALISMSINQVIAIAPAAAQSEVS